MAFALLECVQTSILSLLATQQECARQQVNTWAGRHNAGSDMCANIAEQVDPKGKRTIR